MSTPPHPKKKNLLYENSHLIYFLTWFFLIFNFYKRLYELIGYFYTISYYQLI